MNIRHAIPLVLLFFLIACNITDYKVADTNAEWSMPLLSGNINATNLVRQTASDAEILVQADGSILLRYLGSTLAKTKKEIFLPVQSGGIPIPMTDTSTRVTLPVVGNVIIKKATLSNGNYWFSYSHSRVEDIKLQLFVPQMKRGNQILNHIIEVPYRGTSPTFGSTDKFSLDDIEMIPDNNQIDLRYAGINANQNRFKINTLFFQFDQLDFKYLQGYIGQNVYDLKKDSIIIDLYDSFIPGALIVDDPKVIMTVTNSFGFPSKALINDFTIQTKSGLISFKSKLFDEGMLFNYPVLAESGQSKTTTFVFDKNNSNVREVLNAQAQRVIYDIDALSNPNQVQDSTYFINDNARVEVKVSVEFPLKVKVNQYPADKTFEVDASALADLREGSLLIESSNTIPMSANAQFYLFNSTNQLIDSVFAVPQLVFAAAGTNDAGISVNAAIHRLTIPVPADKIVSWSKTKKFKITAWFNTPANKNIVQISDKDNMNIKMAFVGKLK